MIPAAGPCPVCGAPHATCGRGSAAVPVDLLTTIPKGNPVLKKYRTTVNGVPTTLKLSAEDAKAYPAGSLTEVGGITGETEASEGDGDAETKARKPPANKARTATADKS